MGLLRPAIGGLSHRLLHQAYQRLGNRHYQQGEYTEAVAAYNKAIELAPNVGLTYLLRGNVNAASGLHQRAIGDYDKAIAQVVQLPPTIQDTVFLNRGNSKAELSDYNGALQDYTEAIRKNPNLPQTYYNRGNTYADLYRFEEALLDYDQVTGTGPGVMPPSIEVILYWRLGQLKEARRCYLDAVAKGVDHDGINQNLWTIDQILLVVNDLGVYGQGTPRSGHKHHVSEVRGAGRRR